MIKRKRHRAEPPVTWGGTDSVAIERIDSIRHQPGVLRSRWERYDEMMFGAPNWPVLILDATEGTVGLWVDGDVIFVTFENERWCGEFQLYDWYIQRHGRQLVPALRQSLRLEVIPRKVTFNQTEFEVAQMATPLLANRL